MHVNSTSKFQFRTIDVEKGEILFRDPQTFKNHLSSRKELIKAWNEESQLREAELNTYYNEIHNPRDELVQAPDTEAGAEGDKGCGNRFC